MYKTDYIFLTRGELHILGKEKVSIHLRPNDSRCIKIAEMINDNFGNINMDVDDEEYGFYMGPKRSLKVVTIDPNLVDYCGSFYRGFFYLIPTLEYQRCITHSGYKHFEFSYKLDDDYVGQKKGARLLSTYEISTFRKTQSLL